MKNHNSILKFFQVDSAGMFRMTSSVTYASLLRTPRFWLVLQMLLFIVVGGFINGWHVQYWPDSWSYIKVSTMSLREGLGASRTLGYPLLLRVAAFLSNDYSMLPWLQWALLFLAVLVFDYCLRTFGVTPSEAYAVSTGFWLGCLQQLWLVTSVMTDFLAMVFSGVACGCLFWLMGRPRSLWAWSVLILSLTLSYHFRPIYLMLIPLIPVLAVALSFPRACRAQGPWIGLKIPALLFVLALIPYLAYCTLRWSVVGDFGLVAFQGVTASGMAVELLDRELIERELPESWKSLAENIYQTRSALGTSNAFLPNGWVNMRLYEQNYSPNLFVVAQPSAIKIYGDNRLVYDQRLKEFAWEVISRRKLRYLVWAVNVYPRSVAKMLYRSWVLQLLVPFSLAVFCLRKWMCGKNPSLLKAFTPVWLHEFFWLAFVYYLANVTVLVLSGVAPDSRYVVCGGVFIPCFFTWLVFRDMRWLLSVHHAFKGRYQMTSS